MKIKKSYNAPKISSEKISIGVFGKYGHGHGKPSWIHSPFGWKHKKK